MNNIERQITVWYLLDDDALGVGRATERVSLPTGAKMGLLVLLVMPALCLPVQAHFARRAKTFWLAHLDAACSEHLQ